MDVILYHQPDDKKKNRGFCFLEYEDHKSAAQARRRLMSGKVKVWGNVVTVEWADPVEEPDPEVMAKVSKDFTGCSLVLCEEFLYAIVTKICSSWAGLVLRHKNLLEGIFTVSYADGLVRALQMSCHWKTLETCCY